MKADLCEKDQHILQGASVKQKEILPGFFVFSHKSAVISHRVFSALINTILLQPIVSVCATLTLSNQLCGNEKHMF